MALPLVFCACGSDSGGNEQADAGSPDASPLVCTDAESACGNESCCTADQTCAYEELCVLSDDTCTTSDDCQNDGYCDTELGLCIPYGEGPGGNVDENCSTLAVAGVFAPNVQCEWSGPPAGDPYPNHRNVLGTPMVIDFDFDGDPNTIEPSIVFVSYDGIDGNVAACVGSDIAFGVIRIIDGDTCVQQANADSQRVVASTPLALADLDNDSDNRPEIIGHRVGGGMFSLKWDEASTSFVDHWQTTSTLGAGICLWSGPSIHDLDNDTIPEIIMGASVFDGITGAAIDESLGLQAGQVIRGHTPVIADLQGDNIPELVNGNSIYRWDTVTNGWIQTGSGLGSDGLVAVADFGTYGDDPNNDDRSSLDGIAEVVVVSGGTARLMARTGRVGPSHWSFSHLH